MDEASKNTIITYCAGCAQELTGNGSVFHLIDLLFDPDCITSGKPRATRSPLMTYLNRLWLKHALKKLENPANQRERIYIGPSPDL